LTASEVEAIAKRYGVDYFLTESGLQGNEVLLQKGYAPVFKNDAFIIFQLRGNR